MSWASLNARPWKERTQGQHAPTTPVYAILKTAIFILTDPRECKRQKPTNFLIKKRKQEDVIITCHDTHQTNYYF